MVVLVDAVDRQPTPYLVPDVHGQRRLAHRWHAVDRVDGQPARQRRLTCGRRNLSQLLRAAGERRCVRRGEPD